MENAPLVVYDVDDILWPLSETTAKICGIDPARMIEFDIFNNKLLTPAERELISETWYQISLYESLEFFPGVEDILAVQEFGARVEIHSNSLTEEIVNLKRERLLATVPGLRAEQLFLNIITHETARKKVIPPDTLVLIDDSPYNIATSPARVNIVPFTYWNDTERGRALMRNKNLLRVPFGSLRHINELAKKVVSFYCASSQ